MRIRHQRAQDAHNVPTEPQPVVVEQIAPVAEPLPVAEQATPPPATVELIGIRPAPNKNFIYASHNGERVTVFAGKRWAARLAGKKFKATVENDGAQTTYRYDP